VRKLVEHRPNHGEPTEARVEDADRRVCHTGRLRPAARDLGSMGNARAMTLATSAGADGGPAAPSGGRTRLRGSMVCGWWCAARVASTTAKA
jgi:hypothetical protein